MGIGDFMTDFLGSKNKEHAEAPKIDGNAYQWGGRQGGADADADRFGNLAQNAQNRQGEQINYDQANQDRSQQQQARGNQMGLASMMQARASGQTPSIAQMQADRQMQQAQQSQASQAASARGSAGLALAGQNAANNMANTQSNISGQAQINAANERMQAEQAAFGAYSGIRGGDMASQQQSAQQSQMQAQMNQQQRAQNDSFSAAMYGNQMGVRQGQLSAGQNQQAQQSSNELGAKSINASIAAQNAQQNQQNGMGLLGMAQSGLGAIAGAFADGGLMPGGKPALVGERGPEVVVPPNNGGPNAGKPGGPSMGMSQNGQQADHSDALGRLADVHALPATSMLTKHEAPGFAKAMMPGAATTGDAMSEFSRATGGPVSGERPYVVGERGPEIVVPKNDGVVIPNHALSPADIAMSTWGGKGPDVAAQEQAVQEEKDRQLLARQSVQLADSTESPWEREQRRFSALKQTNPELITDADRKDAKRARSVLRNASAEDGEEKPKAEAKDAKAAEATKPKPTLSSVMGGMGKETQDRAARIDTGYRAPTAFVSPNLIPVGGARAEGGPVDSGKGYLVGEKGPEVMLLSEQPGQQLHQSVDSQGRGHAFTVADPSVSPSTIASLSGPTPRYSAPSSSAPRLSSVMSAPKEKKKDKPMTPDEAKAAAERLRKDMEDDFARYSAAGPAVRRGA